jgi:hypothetical protein
MRRATLLHTSQRALVVGLVSGACAWSVACENNLTHPPDTTPYEAGTIAPLSCVPNLDGVIESSELQPSLGVPASYRVNAANTTRAVDVAGEVNSSGQLVWDWGASYADDQVATIEAAPLQGKWYASSFPGGQYAAPFDAGDTIEAVYSQDANGAYIHGLASTQQNPPNGQTLWAYDSPVTLYQFPLKPGTTWSTSGTIRNGIVEGLPYAATDTYQGTDDATGQLVLPDFTFTQAHRLRFVVTTVFSAGGAPQATEQVSFLSECAGEIGRATAAPIDDGGALVQNFTTAAQQRRLGM